MNALKMNRRVVKRKYQLTTAINSTNRSRFVLIALALASLALLPAARAQSTEMASDSPGGCSAATLNGTYMSEQRGDLNGLPMTQVNRIVFDGVGGITGSGTIVVNGVVTTIPLITATYTVNSDCTGTLSSVPAGLSQNFVVRVDGSQVFFIVTAHPAGVATISGEAVRLTTK
jgi:hypothetical protein